MSDLFEKIKLLQGFGKALQTGLEQSISALPALARQQLTVKARNKLHSSLDEYLDSVKTSFDNYVFVVELDKDSWLANAVESGADGFEMTKGFFNSPKAKISKDGFKYLRIPMSVDPKRKADTMGTEKAQYYQRMIDHALRKPKFQQHSVSADMKGGVIEVQKLITDTPEAQGLMRARKFKSGDDFNTKKGGSKFQYMLMRTVSEKGSATGAIWRHPGVKPAHLFKELERDLTDIFERLLEQNIKNEMDKL